MFAIRPFAFLGVWCFEKVGFKQPHIKLPEGMDDYWLPDTGTALKFGRCGSKFFLKVLGKLCRIVETTHHRVFRPMVIPAFSKNWAPPLQPHLA
jgi:hypothetical protein